MKLMKKCANFSIWLRVLKFYLKKRIEMLLRYDFGSAHSEASKKRNFRSSRSFAGAGTARLFSAESSHLNHETGIWWQHYHEVTQSWPIHDTSCTNKNTTKRSAVWLRGFVLIYRLLWWNSRPPANQEYDETMGRGFACVENFLRLQKSYVWLGLSGKAVHLSFVLMYLAPTEKSTMVRKSMKEKITSSTRCAFHSN